VVVVGAELGLGCVVAAAGAGAGAGAGVTAGAFVTGGLYTGVVDGAGAGALGACGAVCHGLCAGFARFGNAAVGRSVVAGASPEVTDSGAPASPTLVAARRLADHATVAVATMPSSAAATHSSVWRFTIT
jgi:hypothetical protein